MLSRGLKGMRDAAARYHERFTNEQKTPKAKDLRPFQLACQNVIIAMAAMRYEAKIDAHEVHQWLTCEAAHVATNEGVRALSILMLCDAYQAGGTMEIDFSRHPERNVPAALRRFGRTVGIELGRELADTSISPQEARQLFLAVTPMPGELRTRVDEAIDRGYISAESLCYSLASPIWRPIELDFLLACSARVPSILAGGAEVADRAARSSEMEACRAALITGTLLRRLDSKDAVAGDGTGSRRVFDDVAHGVRWSILPEYGAVYFENVPPGDVPWLAGSSRAEINQNGGLVMLPRPHLTLDDLDVVEELRELYEREVPVVIAAPAGQRLALGDDVNLLRYPGDMSDLDKAALLKLRAARLARS